MIRKGQRRMTSGGTVDRPLKKRFLGVFLIAIAACSTFAVERPTGWTALSHSSDAEPSYDVVLAQGAVLRIDFQIAPDDWQAMLDDLYANFAHQPGGKTYPEQPNYGVDGKPQAYDPHRVPPHIEACVGKSEGDPAVLVDPSGREIEGTCGYDPKGQLAFMPNQAGPIQKPNTPPQERSSDRVLGFPNAGGANPIYVETTCRFGNYVWEHVGIRFKGNSSLRDTAQSGVLKIPLHLEFDHYEDEYPETNNQRFFGFKDLSLSNGFRDATLLREKTTNDFFRAAGVPCAVSAFYRVYVDYGEGPRYFGLYTMTEIPDDPMLDLLFGNSGGNLYKPEGGAATFSQFDESAFEKKTNTEDEDWSDIIAVIDALNDTTGDVAAWRAGLEEVFNVQAFLRWLAVDTIVGNWDTYGRMPHNYYLYSDEDDSLLNWIPWDNNEAFSDWFSPIRNLSLKDAGNEWPLIRRLADDRIYYACYLNYVQETLDTVLDVPMLQDQVRAHWNLILPYVVGGDGEQRGFTLLRNPRQFSEGLEQLLDYIERRHREVESFLTQERHAARQVAITEIHYNPAAEQGGDDTHEFLELTNLGDRTASLSGWRFVDGIEFVFPNELWLEPGESLLLAKAAATYSGAGFRVLQWMDGKLANDGERLELVDADNVTVDLVSYDDDAPWDESADGGGRSLVPVDVDRPNDLVLNWQASSDVGGSPGTIDR